MENQIKKFNRIKEALGIPCDCFTYSLNEKKWTVRIKFANGYIAFIESNRHRKTADIIIENLFNDVSTRKSRVYEDKIIKELGYIKYLKAPIWEDCIRVIPYGVGVIHIYRTCCIHNVYSVKQLKSYPLNNIHNWPDIDHIRFFYIGVLRGEETISNSAAHYLNRCNRELQKLAEANGFLTGEDVSDVMGLSQDPATILWQGKGEE